MTKLFKKDSYTEVAKDHDLLEIAQEIVDKLAPRWPWEDAHEHSIEYVLTVLRRVYYERN